MGGWVIRVVCVRGGGVCVGSDASGVCGYQRLVWLDSSSMFV